MSSPEQLLSHPAAYRLDRLDALRGLAIVWMTLFHFGFDLNHFGLLASRHNFHHDPLWTTQRTCIVGLFLLCAGMGQACALHGRAGPRFTAAFWRRWAQIAGCAALVSLGSAWMFPRSWISFGVLHGVAVMLILARWVGAWRAWLWPLGAVCIAMPQLVQHRFFDQSFSHWLGLVTRKPITEDWVPVLPWLGVMLWGLALGQWLLQHRPHWLATDIPPALRPLATLGRWSLSFYMLHQPVLIGALLAGRGLRWW